jgi:hypothetical protein
MASTRNLNTPSDYKLKKIKDKEMDDYLHYQGSRVNQSPALFKNGPNPNMYGGELSKNMVDVESMLRGIRATDLEGESFSVNPSLKQLNEISYFDKIPLIIPPSYQTTMERPNYLG